MRGFAKRMTEIAIILLLFLFSIICGGSVFAASSTDISLRITGASESEISFIVQNPEYLEVLAVTATYSDGRQQEIIIDSVEPGANTWAHSVPVTKPYDSYKIILLDAKAFTPLCSAGKQNTVTFSDYDGRILSSQTVASGNDAVPPEAPVRSGYIFTRWSCDYSEITDDLTVCAEYVSQDADNIFTVSSVSAQPGDEVTVSVKLEGTVGLCAFNLKLEYDDEALEYIGLDDELSFDLTASHSVSGSYILLNYSSRQNTTMGGDIIDITFKLKNSGKHSAAIKLIPLSVSGIAPSFDPEAINPPGTGYNDVPYTLCEGVIIIK